MFGDFELHRLFAAGLTNGGGNAFNGLRGGVCHGGDGGCVALRFVDGGLFFALGAGNESLAFARGDVDLLLTTAFRRGNQGAFFALGGDLRLHGVQNFGRWRQVFDFVAQHLHAPVERGLVNCGHHLRVDDVALFKSFVQFQLTNHAAQAGLRQLRHRHDVVGRAIARQPRVGHLEIQNAIDLQLRVVACDANLARHVQRNFFQAVLLNHVVNEGHNKI